jgi:hypothetical protein
MIPGDLVRFKRHEKDDEWNVGLLVEYKPWMKIAEVLWEGKSLRVHARFVQMHKPGKKGPRNKPWTTNS